MLFRRALRKRPLNRPGDFGAAVGDPGDTMVGDSWEEVSFVVVVVELLGNGGGVGARACA